LADAIVRIEPYGAVIYLPGQAATVRLDREEARSLLDYGGNFPENLTAPEIAHLEISNRCNLNCRYCYVDKRGRELTTGQWKRIIEDLARNGIFQLTLGGGEPFMRGDIFELASFVRGLGMNLALTTNGTLLEDDPRLALFRQINFSVHGNLEELKPKIELALKHTKVGINFVVRRSTLGELRQVADYCRLRGIELLLLSYKPVNGDAEEAIKPSVVMQFGMRLASTGVRVAVDGMTCGKCLAAQRFVDIDSLGNVFPCSFIREPIGNLLEQPFAEIWRRRKVPERCPYE